MRRLLEAMDSMSRAETKPTGPKFPGYWKGTDPASAAKNKMVGGCEQESVIPELAKTAKKKSTEWNLEEAFNQFKEAGEFRRDVVPQPAKPIDTSLPPGYNAPLPKLSDPKGDQIGGFKKVLPGEPFDSNQWSLPGKLSGTPDLPVSPNVNTPLYTGDSNPPEAGDPGLGVKYPTDTFSRPDAQGIRAQPRFKSGKEPVELKNPEPIPPVSVTDTVKVNPATDKPVPTKPELAGPPDTFIKDKNGEWIENPAKSVTPAPAVEPKADDTLRSKINKASDASDNSPVKPGTTTPTQTAPEPKPGSWQELAKLNNITDPTKLKAGTRINTPDGGSVPVMPGDTLSSIARTLRTGGQPSSQIQQKPPAPAVKIAPTPEIPRGRPTMPDERNQTLPAATTLVPGPTAPPAPDNKAPSIYGPEKQKADQEIIDKAKELEKRRSGQQQSAPSRRPPVQSTPAPNTPQSSVTIKPAPEPNISSQAGQDAQWEKDKERMKGWLPDWVKGKSDNKPVAPANVPASTSLNDTRRQADIAALKREINRTPAHEKTRLGILNKELADRQQVATNESLSQRLAKDFEQFLESDEPYAGYDRDVEKLKQRAKLGPMKTVWDEKTQRYRVVPVKPQEKQIKEYGNTQNADTQATNADTQQTSHAVDPSNPDAMAQKVDIATAKATMSGLKNVLGPQLNTNAAASGIVNMNDGKPLSVPEREAISTLTPLVTKAAENPATASALKTALSTAGMLAKQGK